MSNKTLTRADLVANAVSEFSITKTQATIILDNILTEISQTLSQCISVKLSSFGTFSVRQKRERMGRNPRTGETAIITPRKVISFRSSSFAKKLRKEQSEERAR